MSLTQIVVLMGPWLVMIVILRDDWSDYIFKVTPEQLGFCFTK